MKPKHYGIMKMLRTVKIIGLMVVAALMCPSCIYDKDVYGNGGGGDEVLRQKVSFDWTAITTPHPQSLTLAFFRDGASEPVLYGVLCRPQVEVALAADTWRTIAWNSDAESLAASGSTYDTYTVRALNTTVAYKTPAFQTSRSIPRAQSTEDETVIMQPDSLLVGTQAGFEVSMSHDEDIPLTMQAAVNTFTVTISNVQNLAYVTDVMATLSGMSGGYQPGTDMLTDASCIIPFALKSDGSSRLEGSCTVFGTIDPAHWRQSAQAHSVHQLVVYAILTDGTKWYTSYDVTNAVNTAEQQGITQVHIEIDKLPFPKPITNGSGVHPTMEEWNEVDINVNM